MGGDPRTWDGVLSAKSRGGLAGCAICVREEARTAYGRGWKLPESGVAPSVGLKWPSGFHLVFPFPGGWPAGGGVGVPHVSLLF